jgi:hypothetical protein
MQVFRRVLAGDVSTLFSIGGMAGRRRRAFRTKRAVVQKKVSPKIVFGFTDALLSVFADCWHVTMLTLELDALFDREVGKSR